MPEIWSVGKSAWGRWEVRQSTTDKPNEFTIKEYLGKTLRDAAIELDGTFTLDESGNFIAMTTQEPNNLFVVTESGKLYRKAVGAPVSTAYLVAENVLKVSACQGWMSSQFNVDSGLWVAYLKENHDVCYRVFYSKPSVPYWDPEVVVGNVPEATDVEVRRMNEYRMGIYTSNAGLLFLTPQTFIGDTVKKEMIAADTSVPFLTIPMRDNRTVLDDVLEVVATRRESPTKLVATFNYPVFDGDPGYASMKMGGNPPSGQGIQSFSFAGDELTINLKQAITTALAELKFTILPGRRFQYQKNPQDRPVWELDEVVFPSEPIETTETVAAVFKISTSLNMKKREDIVNQTTEMVDVTLSAAPGLQMVHVKEEEIDDSTEKRLISDFVHATLAAVGVLNMTQTGDTPI